MSGWIFLSMFLSLSFSRIFRFFYSSATYTHVWFNISCYNGVLTLLCVHISYKKTLRGQGRSAIGGGVCTFILYSFGGVGGVTPRFGRRGRKNTTHTCCCDDDGVNEICRRQLVLSDNGTTAPLCPHYII